jgi:hypothetical protein
MRTLRLLAGGGDCQCGDCHCASGTAISVTSVAKRPKKVNLPVSRLTLEARYSAVRNNGESAVGADLTLDH